jgi:hypothetical protein
MMLSHTADEEAGWIEITIDGKIGAEDFDPVVAAADSLIARHGKINAIEIIRNFEGMDPAIWWKDLSWGMRHIAKFSRVAVVTDSGWIGPMTRAFGALMPAEIRTFSMADLEKARAWIRTGVTPA